MVNGHIFGETGDICLLDLRIVKIVEVIEDDDGVSCPEQAFNEMGADETSSACFRGSQTALQFKNCASASADKSSLAQARRRPRFAQMFSLFPCINISANAATVLRASQARRDQTLSVRRVL